MPPERMTASSGVALSGATPSLQDQHSSSMPINEPSTAAELAAHPLIRWFDHRVRASPERMAYCYKDRAIWHGISWAEFGERVRELAFGLMDAGLSAGCRVLWIGGPAPVWPEIELAVEAVGASLCLVDVNQASQRDLGLIAEDLRPQLVIGLTQADVKQVGDRTGETKFSVIVQAATTAGEGCLLLDELRRRGAELTTSDGWSGQIAERSADDVIRVALTSGVGRQPRLVELTSADVLKSWGDLWFSGEVGRPRPTDRTMTLQSAARTSELVSALMLPIIFGVTAHLPESFDSRDTDLIEVSPTIVIAPPRVWRLWAGAVRIEMADAGHLKRRVVERLARGRLRRWHRNPRRLGISDLPWAWGLRGPMLTKLGLRQVRVALVGGEPVSDSLVGTWASWGVPLTEIYGTAETADLIAVRPASCWPEESLRLLGDRDLGTHSPGAQELVLHEGPGVSTAYVANGVAEPRGSLHTGDLVQVDQEQRSIRVMGRIADRMTLPDGRVVVPEMLEGRLADHPYVSSAVVLCEGRVAPVALLELSFRDLAERARHHGVTYTSYESLVSGEFGRRAGAEVIDQVNMSLAAHQLPPIRDFVVFPRRLEAALGELTLTRKVDRRIVVLNFQDLLTDLHMTTADREGGN